MTTGHAAAAADITWWVWCGARIADRMRVYVDVLVPL
jgi:hypothetical protein